MAALPSGQAVHLVHAITRAKTLPDAFEVALPGVHTRWHGVGDLHALISTVTAPDGVDAASLVAGGEQAMDLAMAHNRLLAALVAQLDFAPVALGRAWPDVETLEADIQARSGEFNAALDRTAGHVEYAVKVLSSKVEHSHFVI